MIVLIIIAFLLFAAPLPAAPEGAAKDAPSFNTPKDVSEWMSRELTYQWEMPDRWQAPAETVNLKKGDCEDFAALSQELLDGVGVRCEIAIIKFKGLEISHAVCIWQDGNNYKFMSNQELVETQEGSLEGAIGKMYPDWERITFTDTQRKTAKTIIRKNK